MSILTPVTTVLVSPTTLAALRIPFVIALWIPFRALPVALLCVVPFVTSLKWVGGNSCHEAEGNEDVGELHDVKLIKAS